MVLWLLSYPPLPCSAPPFGTCQNTSAAGTKFTLCCHKKSKKVQIIVHKIQLEQWHNQKVNIFTSAIHLPLIFLFDLPTADQETHFTHTTDFIRVLMPTIEPEPKAESISKEKPEVLG